MIIRQLRNVVWMQSNILFTHLAGFSSTSRNANGKKCFTCDDEGCSKVMSCWGDENHCFTTKTNGQNVVFFSWTVISLYEVWPIANNELNQRSFKFFECSRCVWHLTSVFLHVNRNFKGYQRMCIEICLWSAAWTDFRIVWEHHMLFRLPV